MFPTQPLHHQSSADGHSLAASASTILSIAASALAPTPHRRLERRFLVFPLFLAGVALAVTRTAIPPVGHGSGTAGADQALELLRVMESESVGRNTGATRRVLQRVMEACEDVYARKDTGAPSVAVDWFAVAERLNVEVIHFGL